MHTLPATVSHKQKEAPATISEDGTERLIATKLMLPFERQQSYELFGSEDVEFLSRPVKKVKVLLEFFVVIVILTIHTTYN